MSAHAWDERYAASGLVWSAEPNRFVAAELAVGPPYPGATALDVACGEGRNAVWLAEQGWAAVGVDFSEVALEKGRALAKGRGVEVDWRQVDVRDWRSHQRFDLVLVAYLHLPQEELTPVLAAAADAVAEGGTFLAVGHHAENLEYGHGGPPDPAVLWDPVEVATALQGRQRGDLVVDRAERVLRSVQTDDGERTAIDALVRAHRPTVG